MQKVFAGRPDIAGGAAPGRDFIARQGQEAAQKFAKLLASAQTPTG